MRRLKQIFCPITQILQCRALKHKVLLIPKTPCWHITQILSCLGTPSKHPVSLGSLWQPTLKRKKRCNISRAQLLL